MRSRFGARVTIAIVLAGFVLRLARPEVHSFWIDEGLSLRIARAGDMIAALRDDSHPPLSFLVWRAWGSVFGWSDLALRILPALVSCGSLVLFVQLARAWVGRERAVGAVALYAVSPLLVWIAHEVRMYAFVELVTLCTLLAARAAWRETSVWRWLVVAGCVAIATGLHYYGALVGPVIVAQAFVRARGGNLSRTCLVMTAAACAIGVAVWTPWFLTVLPAQYSNDWPRIARFTWRDLVEAPARLVAVDFAALTEHGVAWVGWVLGGLCVLGLCAAVVVRIASSVGVRRSRDAEEEVATGEMLCAALVPIGAALALAVFVRGGFQPRYLITAVPGTIACTGLGLGMFRPVWVGRAGVGALVGCALVMCGLQLSENRREDYRDVCREVAERFRPGDRVLVIVCVPEPCRLVTVDHYLRDRPDVMASVLDMDDYLAGKVKVPAGTVIHVIWREASLCFEPFERLRRTHVLVEEVPARFRMHRCVAVAP